MVARLGGDEFAILLRLDRRDRADGDRPAASWPSWPSRSSSRGSRSALGRRSGITVVTASDNDGSEVLRRADVAMYQAKSSRSASRSTTPSSTSSRGRACSWPRTCARASPRARSRSGTSRRSTPRTMQVHGLEALVRWRHPPQGLLSPVAFLPAARRAGLMGALSETIARRPCVTCSGCWTARARPARRDQLRAPELLGHELHPAALRAARGVGGPGRPAGPRGHRGLVPGRPRTRAKHPPRPARARRPGLHRRLRHRLLLA